MVNFYKIGLIATISLFFFLTFLFFWKGLIYLDPDFGWHLQTGELILHSGFPKNDPFSYTMSNYQYIDFEWLSDVLIAIIYNLVGIPVIAFFYALVAISSLLIAIPKGKIRYTSPIVLLIGATFLSGAGIRVQLITWLFLAILLNILNGDKNWLKYRLFLPIIFLFWINMHGGFLIGYTILFFYLLLRFLTRRATLLDALVVIGSLVVSLINPYGLDLWRETLKQSWLLSTNSYLKQSIDEWTPIYTRFSPALCIYFICSLYFIVRYFRKFSLFQIGVFIGLGLMAISAIRHVPLWIIASIPIVAEGLIQTIKQFKLNIKFKLLIPVTFLLFVAIFINFVWYSRDIIHTSLSWSETYFYPEDATSYLNYNHISKVFAPYTWGGYIIWKTPQTKVFIDGRMPTWTQSQPNGQQGILKIMSQDVR